jgi:hypothetical protein
MSTNNMRTRLTKTCGRFGSFGAPDAQLRKTRVFSGVFPQRIPQNENTVTAILSKPLQTIRLFSARIYCYYLKQYKLGFSKEEIWT